MSLRVTTLPFSADDCSDWLYAASVPVPPPAMVVLAQPAAYGAWDPLLQRFVADPPFPCTTAASPPSRIRATPPPHGDSSEPSLSASPLRDGGHSEAATPAAHAAPASPASHPTPAELEASSLALAMRLQQEEQEQFLRAMNSSTPAARGARAASEAPEEMDTDDDSLQLAIRLQQEELQWQALQARQSFLAAMGGTGASFEGLDDETRAMLQAEREQE
ncbi:hypothetical protein AB1Y20_021257 [Prymnesium parvum]|uniref:Uncharacterized protein n=1 Tax=Prymnesium parvum TaxID=97485 RepID=A0AB34JJ26_PRYPA